MKIDEFLDALELKEHRNPQLAGPFHLPIRTRTEAGQAPEGLRRLHPGQIDVQPGPVRDMLVQLLLSTYSNLLT